MLQLLDARRGGNLDASLLSPITGGASQINVYGAINGASVFRPNAMTGDPNHLGIMLIVPLLVLTPLYLRLERGHRMRRWLAPTIGFLLIVEAATLSRSGLLGLGVGALILAVPYRRYLRTPQLLVPIGARGRDPRRDRALAAVVLHDDPEVAGADERRLRERALPGLLVHPARAPRRPAVRARAEHVLRLLRVRHRQDELGPAQLLRRADRRDRARRHRAVRGLPLLGVPRASHAARALGRALAAARDPLAARVRPLAWGCTAALVGTLASNAFYLTMQFYYFYAFVALALAIPVVFARRE